MKHGVDGTNGLSSFKPCAYCRIVHHTDIFAIAQLSCFIMLLTTKVCECKTAVKSFVLEMILILLDREGL